MVPPFLGLVSYSERINRTFLFRSSSRREGGSDPRERKGAETAQAGKSVTKDPTLEEALDGPLHHRTPGPIISFVEVGVSLLELLPVVFQTLVEGGVLRMTGPVGASEGHALPETFAGARGSNRIGTSGSVVHSTFPGNIRTSASRVRRGKAALFPVGERPTRQPLQPEATGATMEVTKWLKPLVKRVTNW